MHVGQSGDGLYEVGEFEDQLSVQTPHFGRFIERASHQPLVVVERILLRYQTRDSSIVGVIQFLRNNRWTAERTIVDNQPSIVAHGVEFVEHQHTRGDVVVLGDDVQRNAADELPVGIVQIVGMKLNAYSKDG